MTADLSPQQQLQQSTPMPPSGFMPDGSFRHPAAPQLMMRLADIQDNDQLLELISAPMPSNGVMVGMERSPSYFNATQTQYTDPQPWVIFSDEHPNVIMAMYNIGERPCYVNGQVEQVRYIGDLRVNTKVRGKGLVRMMMKHLPNFIQGDAYVQTLILSGNTAAREMLHQSRSGFPQHYERDLIETLTMTGLKSKVAKDPSLSFKTALPTDVPAMSDWVRQMSAYFNFLPDYHFEDLLAGAPYWRGLNINDFTLVYRDRVLVGLFGLWNQKPFKQTRIVDYHRLIGVARPFYNIFAQATERMLLPKRGELVPYLMLHSALCDPADVALFDQMVREAYRQTKARGQRALCFSLSQHDPRVAANTAYKGERIIGHHAFHSYGQNPLLSFDAHRVSYIECGRV